MTSTRRRVDRIDGNLCDAETLPSEYYTDESYFERIREGIFARSWQFISDTDQLPKQGCAQPLVFLEGCVNEPLILSTDETSNSRLLSNVCTHRGNILLENACESSTIRCRYHGRRFDLQGQYVSAPGFERAENFPAERDNLPAARMQMWEKFVFASIDPLFACESLIDDMQRRLYWLPFESMRILPERCKDYFFDANWALYVDNYLEGLHIPFIHPDLSSVIDTKDYVNEVHKFSNLQIGKANDKRDAFEFPFGAPDSHKQIAAYYYWLFPNMMFNFYPWGISINIVVPLAVNRTKVRFITYVYDESRMDTCPVEMIEKTEFEDQAIVTQVQKGVESRLYKRGRYSPDWEINLHHFHTLLTTFLS